MITDNKLITLLYTLIVLLYLLLYYSVPKFIAIITTVNVHLLSDDYCTLYGFLILSIRIWTMSHITSSCIVLKG